MDGGGAGCEVTNSVFHPRASVASDCQPCHDAAMKADLPIEVDPEIMSGAPVFAGTRVPVETLFDYLMKGSSLGEFLECFPTVKREDALLLLDHSKHEALTEAAA